MNRELKAFADSSKKSSFCYPFVIRTTQKQYFVADKQIVMWFTIDYLQT